MQPCKRCGGRLEPSTPKDVVDGKVYHVYCGYKVREKLKEEKREAEWHALQSIKGEQK